MKATKGPKPKVLSVSAWIVTNNRADQDCQVLDISSKGAKVVVKATSAIPDLCVPKIRFGLDAAGGRRKLAS